MTPPTKSVLTYTDHDGAKRKIKDCTLYVDNLDRHWIWSEQLKQNLVFKTKGRENALIAAIDSLLFIIELRDERINALQRIADLAIAFADQIKPDEEYE
jgi:hypothetical protein